MAAGMSPSCSSYSAGTFFKIYYSDSPQRQAGASWRADDSQSCDLVVLESGGGQWMERGVREVREVGVRL